MNFMVGQRVIYNNVICTICHPETNNSSFDFWIDNPDVGFKHGVSIQNIQRLPNGQL